MILCILLVCAEDDFIKKWGGVATPCEVAS